MSLGDHAGEIAVEKLTTVTLPALIKAIHDLVEKLDTKFDQNILDAAYQLHGLLDRLNGATATITFKIPERTP